LSVSAQLEYGETPKMKEQAAGLLRILAGNEENKARAAPPPPPLPPPPPPRRCIRRKDTRDLCGETPFERGRLPFAA
jgi:hypothetical protein